MTAPNSPQPPSAASNTNKRRIALFVGAAAVVLIATAVAVTLTVMDKKGSTGNSAAPNDTTRSSSSAATSTGSSAPETATTPALPPGVAAMPPFTPTPGIGANCQYTPAETMAARPVKPPRAGKVPTDPAQVSATITTNHGKIGLLLANNESPCTVNSFASLAAQGYFNGTNCHRLTTSLTLSVLQCGDPRGDGTGGPGYQFVNEYPTDRYPPGDPTAQQPVLYPRGTLAMANAGPGTNGSQFFLVYRDSQLPPQYTVFGTIQPDGLAVLEKIAKAGIAGGGEDGWPAADVAVSSIALD